MLGVAVRTYEASDVAADCERLAAMLNVFEPDLIIGIANGGVPVAHGVASHLVGQISVADVRAQRRSTGVKSHPALRGAIRRLPRQGADLLRIFEVCERELVYHLMARLLGRARPARQVELSLAAQNLLPQSARVLIVDDCIDSGETMRRVATAITDMAPDAQVRSAVLASAWLRPPVVPDYVLHQRTLVRLPTSFDACRV